VGTDGFVYVSDQYNYRVVKFTKEGQYVTAWGSPGTGPGQFGRTIGLALDGQGHLYVTEWDNNRIQEFTTTGTFIRQWGAAGTAPGQFESPRHMVIDADGHLDVTDLGNGRIQTFSPDGQLLAIWGLDHLNSPAGIAIGPNGVFYIADEGDFIAMYGPNHDFLGSFGTMGSGGPGEFYGPSGIAADAMGRVIVTDHANNRVQQFTLDGQFTRLWGGIGVIFNTPIDVAVDDEGRIYVVDLGHNMIRVFADLPTAAVSETWGSLKARYR
jgi:DNA-binding beta-propeller fold protein YncE